MKECLHIAFDMSVFGYYVKTGIYRVTDEIYKRLSTHSNVQLTGTLHDFEMFRATNEQLKNSFGNIVWFDGKESTLNSIDAVISPFLKHCEPFVSNKQIIKALIVYDLIPLLFPHFSYDEHTATMFKEFIESIPSDTLVFCISEHTKIDFLQYRQDYNSNNVFVIPLAAGSNFYPCFDKYKQDCIFAKYGINKSEPYFLSLATLEVRKNIDHVLQCFHQYILKHQKSTVQLVLTGMLGWKIKPLQKILQKFGVHRHRVILTGFVPDEELATLYTSATAFIYMSLYEGFGLSPLEAMACGTPVITSNNSSLPEVVGNAGIMLDAKDGEGLCEALHTMLTEPQLRRMYSLKSIERSRNFSWNRTVEIIVNEIGQRLQNKKKQEQHHKKLSPLNLQPLSAEVVSWEAVTWAYRLLLQREPESIDVILDYCKARNTEEMVQSILKVRNIS